MLFKSVLTAALVGSAIAQQHQHHEHHQEKRDAVTVTEVNVVEVTVQGNNPIPTSVAVAQPSLSTLSTITTGSPTISNAPAPPASSVESVSIPVASQPASTGVGAAGAKGVTYSPYSNSGGCKSSSQIASEVSALSGFDVIRLYGVDCNQVEAVLAAKASHQQIFAGIYFMNSIVADIQTLTTAVNNNGGWSNVITVSIGNELVNGGQATPSQIGQYVATGRSALQAAGYTGPVVSVDTFIAVINNPDLCQYSDYIAVNAHAFFDGGVVASDSGNWLLEQLQRVSTACGNSKSVLITETGWPSQGETNGQAVPSTSDQEAAISSIKSVCGNDAILFNAYNDLWKAPGAFNAEQWWGIFGSSS